ncbi:MAG: thermonuclease family protein [Hyphomonas sp.]|nr:thermonuclease family protein [Hyphomonas sp.]
MTRRAIWGLVILLAACGRASPLPDMQPGETGRVVNVIDGDALVLDTGQSVRLVSIEAPALYPRDRPAELFAAESARILEDLTLGRRVQLYYPGITRDRYDRALAHVVTIDGAGPDLWLNAEMLARGGAWVRLYPDTAARGEELLDLEAKAQASAKGLWSSADYRVRDAEAVSREMRGFRLIRGRIGEARPVAADTRYPPACRRALQGADLTLSIRRDARTACGLPIGTEIQVRGYISDLDLDLTYPRHLQVVEID